MSNQEQIEAWDGATGEKWAQHSDLLDQLLSPFLPVLLQAAQLQPSEHVLDIGCGAGALTLEAAAKVGAVPGALGVDVSSKLLEVARKRAMARRIEAKFEHHDASVYQPASLVDVAISRFGVMFFDDPVAAFTSIRANMRPEGRLVFACWQHLKDNEWASALGQIAKRFITDPLPSPDPLAPGSFAFADKDRVHTVLKDAGWKGVTCDAWSGDIVLPGETLEESTAFILNLGPISRLLQERDVPLEPVRDALMEKLGRQLNSQGSPALSGKAWIVSATAP